jgi:hypothetical protein
MWGRLVRPYAFAVSLSPAFGGILILTGNSYYGSGNWARVIAGAAFLATALLWVGWWRKSSTLMQHGLLLTAVVFASRAAYVVLTGESLWAAGYIACWSIASAGAWLLERTTGHEEAVIWYHAHERGRLE